MLFLDCLINLLISILFLLTHKAKKYKEAFKSLTFFFLGVKKYEQLKLQTELQNKHKIQM